MNTKLLNLTIVAAVLAMAAPVAADGEKIETPETPKIAPADDGDINIQAAPCAQGQIRVDGVCKTVYATLSGTGGVAPTPDPDVIPSPEYLLGLVEDIVGSTTGYDVVFAHNTGKTYAVANGAAMSPTAFAAFEVAEMNLRTVKAL